MIIEINDDLKLELQLIVEQRIEEDSEFALELIQCRPIAYKIVEERLLRLKEFLEKLGEE